MLFIKSLYHGDRQGDLNPIEFELENKSSDSDFLDYDTKVWTLCAILK